MFTVIYMWGVSVGENIKTKRVFIKAPAAQYFLTTLVRSGAWWATLNNHLRDNAVN